MEILANIVAFGILLAIGVYSVYSLIKSIKKKNYTEFK